MGAVCVGGGVLAVCSNSGALCVGAVCVGGGELAICGNSDSGMLISD